MSQVKNLRAMFENKGDTSPPDRGRSSGASTPVQGTSGSESPRPLSKVRTSFVAIEKDGRIGLQRNPSHESSVSRRRLSMDTDAESVSTIPDKPSASLEDAPRGNKPFFQEAIPESPRLPIDPPKTPTEQTGAVTDQPSVNLDKQVDQQKLSPSLLPAEPAVVSPKKEPEKEPEKVPEKVSEKENKPITPPPAANGESEAIAVKEPAPNVTAKTTSPVKTTATKKTTATRPSTISTKPATTKPAAKSPALAKPTATKTSAGTAHKPEPKPAPKTAPVAKKEPRPASRTTPAPAATRPNVATTSKKPQPLKPTTSDTGFVKPKPKSPTKPVHLPASLTAPTAASGAKTGRQARPTASSQTLGVPARPASRASSAGAGTSAAKKVKRQPSSVGRSRPSLGPPPKKPAEQPQTKKDAPVDESFLARMMRPTAASSSKTAEKVPTTPPKKTAKRSSFSGTDPRPRDSSVKAPGSARKSSRRPIGSKPKSGSVASDDSHTVETAAEEKASEPTKSDNVEVPVITEETQTNEALKNSKKSESEPAVAEKASDEASESAKQETQSVSQESAKEKSEETRPVTPAEEQPKSVEIPETAATAKSEVSAEKPLASEPEESTNIPEKPVADSDKSTDGMDIVPLIEESSAQQPVAVEETNETSTAELEPETKEPVLPLLEKDTEPAAETEIVEKQTTEIDTATKNDTKEVAEATDAVEEKDTTGEKSDDEKKQ
ncbi:hypothetical protein KAF25_002870 [Fusarium avenaceum]|uniref:Mucin-7 n=1 Tax=Fusarium avenaceum TaxID=40199 RepID=A0A9P7HAK1_9HYPO|nr:hypothetical protein KAF25_002870 [Fusarium avenaceum]